jgi:hypothetical protein
MHTLTEYPVSFPVCKWALSSEDSFTTDVPQVFEIVIDGLVLLQHKELL